MNSKNKNGKKRSVTVSISHSIYKTIKQKKKSIKKIHGVTPNPNPPLESFLETNLLPWLEFLEESAFFISYEHFVKEYPEKINPGEK